MFAKGVVNMKVPIYFNQMTSKELLRLARACIREFNENELEKFKIVQTR